MNKRITVLALSLTISIGAVAGDFVHPGILHTEQSISRMRMLVQDRVEPAYGSYLLLSADPKSSYDYQLQGPYDTIGRARAFQYTKQPCEDDFNAAYYNSIMWVISGDTRHADKSMEIIRAHNSAVRKIMPPDDPLCSGLQGFIIANAEELMRYTYPSTDYPGGWREEDTVEAEQMFRTAFIPIFTEFHSVPAYTNGNWGLSVLKGMIAMGVFLDDHHMFEEAISRYLEAGYDNGSLPNYLAPSGQSQESGRDQAHTQLGLGCMAELCEVAWNQGVDTYSALDCRLLAGFEYTSRFNLGYDDVPYYQWTDKTGKYCDWPAISQQSRGNLRSIYEMAYAHYHSRMHLEMPYTEQVLSRIRPEGKGWTCDHPGFGSLLFYLGDE